MGCRGRSLRSGGGRWRIGKTCITFDDANGFGKESSPFSCQFIKEGVSPSGMMCGRFFRCLKPRERNKTVCLRPERSRAQADDISLLEPKSQRHTLDLQRHSGFPPWTSMAWIASKLAPGVYASSARTAHSALLTPGACDSSKSLKHRVDDRTGQLLEQKYLGGSEELGRVSQNMKGALNMECEVGCWSPPEGNHCSTRTCSGLGHRENFRLTTANGIRNDCSVLTKGHE